MAILSGETTLWSESRRWKQGHLAAVWTQTKHKPYSSHRISNTFYSSYQWVTAIHAVSASDQFACLLITVTKNCRVTPAPIWSQSLLLWIFFFFLPIQQVLQASAAASCLQAKPLQAPLVHKLQTCRGVPGVLGLEGTNVGENPSC